MAQRLRFFFFFFTLLLFFAIHVRAQRTGETAQTVEIITAKRLYLQSPDANTNIQTLAGGVQLRQGKTLFYCDSCSINNTTKIFEAFGNVHINDSDTTNVWSDFLRYQSDKKLAYLSGKVRLTDGKATLTSTDLEYDVANKIGTYKNGGRVVNKKSVLTSREGIYYTDIRDIYFKNDVELKDPAYYLKTDSLLYNTETQVARFIAETYILDSSKREVKTREGYYDLAHNKAEFTSRTTIRDKAMTATGDRIATDDSTGTTQIEGRAVLIDTAQGVNILANRIFANKKTSAYLATQKPLMIIKQDKDSIYVTADTLFSAKLTDLYKGNDSLLTMMGLKESDSTNRYFEAYRHVRIFSDSMQAVSDSMFYTFKDSVFNLYYNPIVWSRKSQITGDTIYLYTKNKKADRVKAFEHSFMVSEVQSGVYNQVKSTRMDGKFRDGVIDSVNARGAAESVYFIQDEDSAFTSVNQTSSEIMDVYFIKGEIHKVILRNTAKGTLYPLSQKRPSDMRLPDFNWYEDRRPKTKYELFQ